MRFIPLFILLASITLYTAPSLAQEITVSGKVVDRKENIPLVGANVLIEGTTLGTVSDKSGNFTLSFSLPPPITLVASFVGYEKARRVVTKNNHKMLIALDEKVILGDEVVVSASLVEERIVQSPVTIEKLDIAAIRQMPAANFYDGLSSLKGVDMTTHSLLFKVPNARGFNGNTGVRMGQMVDGMDNAPPGLNFAAGNIFGVNQLDLESVELLVGASSALYGAGSMNGTLLLTSKNPFEYQGFSASIQLGMMNVGAHEPSSPTLMQDINARYAKAINDKLAFKISVGYLSAEDWHATDYRDRTDPTNNNLTRTSNPGYDGINTYGDDIIVPVNLKDVADKVAAGVTQQAGLQPGTPEYKELYQRTVDLMPDQIISRSGYSEKNLVDYGTRNLRASTAVHYRFRKDLEGIFQAGYSSGTSVYTTVNRFSLKDFMIFSGKLELKAPHFYVRTYTILEDAGDTYDAANTALLMNEAWSPSETWYEKYIESFAQSRILGKSEDEAHDFARLIADNRDRFGNQFSATKPTRPLPGTKEFNQLFNSIAKRPISEGGTKIVDRSKLWHSEFMYNFKEKIKFMEVIAGASYRLYFINSQGTIFVDTPGNPITIGQIGAFAQLSKKILRDRIKLLASARYDKNEFFKGRVTPRVAAVCALDKNANYNLRVSFQTAFRFPTMADQWTNINTGRYHVVGGQASVQNKHQFDTNPVYPLSSTNPITGTPVTEHGAFVMPTFRPERLTSLEVGYKGLHLSKMLLIDSYVYRNEYNGFLADQALVQNPNTPEEKRYLTTISTDFPVRTYGWAFGADLIMMKGFVFRGNVNFNAFETVGAPPKGFQSNFNTPNYRYNLSLRNYGLIRDVGFNINWRWQQEYLWESSFGVAKIPAFGTLDAAVDIKLPRLHSSVKVGGSNLLNRYYTTSLGSAQIGGLYYVTWVLNNI